MTDDDLLADLLLRWEELHDQGQDVTAEELCRDHPNLLVPLNERIQALQKIAWIKKPVEDVLPDSPGPQDTADQPRTLAGRYRLDKLIGEGGFAQVWKGFDLELQRPVAVKVPKPTRQFSTEEVERFVAEARKVAQLRHPGIVAVHDIHRSGGAYFFVTDWIEGSDLAGRLRQGRLGYQDAVRIVAEVARILAYAHGQGFIHRDIKPGNILIDAQGHPLVCDFGIAATEQELLHEPQRHLATLAYGSPEQINGQNIDARTDIYSLGVVLFELLTGRLPFDVQNPVKLKEQIIAQAAPPLRSLDRAMPKALERICSKCLAKNPADRYASALALADALNASVRPRKSWMLIALGGVIVVVSVAIMLTWNPFKSQEDTKIQPGIDKPASRPFNERAVATWVIQKGGRVTPHSKPGTPAKVCRAIEDLPQGEIAIQHVSFSAVHGVEDDDLKNIGTLQEITELTLDGTKITDAGLAHIQGLERLEILRLAKTGITDKGLQTLAHFPRLQVLDLSESKIELKDLNGLRNLRWLACNGTPINDSSLSHIAGLPALEELRVNDTNISDTGLKHLASMSHLRTLEIAHTQVTDSGLQHIKGMVDLRWLNVEDNNLTDTCCEDFEGLAQLQKLYLSDNQIADQGLRRLEKLTQLKELQLRNTLVTDQGVQRFQAAVPKCVVRR